LTTFFFKLCRYLRMPVSLVFVADGPGCPSEKQGKAVNNTHVKWQMNHVRELALMFGFHWHQAPGEAEAELAYLNQQGIIDAILTEDSDTLVFGGKCIIQRYFLTCNANFKSSFEGIVYTEEHIKSVTSLTRGGLILFALLSGGDYSSGLERFGPKTAYALACAGFGDTLIDAVETMTMEDLQDFLSDWRQSLCDELESNAQRILLHSAPLLAASVASANFPDINVLQLYALPVTSGS
ncbi:PIN domain-like protein, partial [Rhodocollybia butyracea]